MKLGKQIVVIEGGFVHVGDCEIKSGFLRIDNAQNIRVWGTTEGLGQLVNGPTASTKADKLGVVLVPVTKVVFYLEVIGGWS